VGVYVDRGMLGCFLLLLCCDGWDGYKYN
jgi:hypothetical protein